MFLAILFRARKTWLFLLTVSLLAVPLLVSACQSGEAPGTEIVFLHRREEGRGEQTEAFDEVFVG
jgi:hypothetical protein